LKEDVFKGPVRIKNAEQVADRLNRGTFLADALTPDSFYAAAGLRKDGIEERIRTEMGQKFPGVRVPVLDGEAVAFGYLKAEAKFTSPFYENRNDFSFAGPAGQTRGLRSFGIFKPGGREREDVREQVGVLYAPSEPETGERMSEFAVDLSKESAPNQIILASLPGKANLADALADLKEKSSSWLKEKPRESELHLGRNDTLVVPEMNWRLTHHFKELEGPDKVVIGSSLAGLYLDTAFQMIDFRLDRQGVAVESKASIPVKGGPRDFHFNRPFLIVIQKRGATRPFFVMWVANDELLLRR
jgi:hypothetical protein